MHGQVTFSAQPPDLQRPAVVVVVLLGDWITAHETGLGRDFASALVHVGISTGIGALALIRRQVRVPWAMGPGVRSMAHAAVPLGQAVVGLTTF